MSHSEVELLPPEKSNINLNEEKINHSKLLKYTKRIGMYWIMISLLEWFFFCCRWYTWILYARSLGQNNETYLAFAVYSVYFIQAFTNLFWGYVSDKFTYDIVAVSLSLCVGIGLLLESFAFNYLMLFIGTIIVDLFRVNLALSIAFLTKYLPNYYAVKYQSFRFASIAIANLIGPIVGGIFTHFFGVQFPFYLSTFIAFLSFLFLLFIINGTQNKIHLKQLKMRRLYQYIQHNEEDDDLLNVDYQFPVSTQKYIMQQKKEKEEQRNSSNNICSNIKHNFPVLTCIEWTILINIIIANAVCMSCEGIFATYFVIFCLDLFKLSVIQSTAMVSEMAFCFVIGCIITPPFIQKYKKNQHFNFEYILLIILLCIFIVFIISSKYFLDIYGSYWLFVICGVNGFMLAVFNMLTEILLLAIQPKHHSGTISGIKTFSRHNSRAFATLIVGLLWSLDIYWFLYGQAMMAFIGLIAINIAFLCYKVGTHSMA